MSIQTAITAAQQKVANAYSAVESKGGTLPETQNLSNLPTAISSISGGGSDARFGKTIANLFGDVDENGSLQSPTPFGNIVFTGVRGTSANALRSSFLDNTGVTSINFPDLVTISGYMATYRAWENCSDITSVSMPLLTNVCSEYGAYNIFNSCYNIASLNISSLTSISGSQTMSGSFQNTAITSIYVPMLTSIKGVFTTNGMFADCDSAETIDVSSLTSVLGQYTISGMFRGCAFASIYFPMLQMSDTNAWGADVFEYNQMLTEVHFRKDMENVVPTFNGHNEKFGATNATIYFDLIGHIVVNGITYARSEQDSTRSNNVKQYVAWVDANITDNNDNVYTRDSAKDFVVNNSNLMLWAWTLGSSTIYTAERQPTTDSKVYDESGSQQGTILVNVYYDLVYTEFDDTTKAEPDVGTAVYSDAGQTVVGNITDVA